MNILDAHIMVEIEVMSHYLFDEKMREMGLNDNNIESHSDMSFISVIGTRECLEYYLDEGETKHYFSDNHKNVLNLDFDDISNDVIYNGHLFKTMTMEQAEKTLEFIENIINEGYDVKFFIHCRAGYSRSRAVAEFIYRYCKENDIEVIYKDRNDYTTMLNSGVLQRLNHALWRKEKRNGYDDENTIYPDELIHSEPKIINRI